MRIIISFLSILALASLTFGNSFSPPDGYAGNPPNNQNCTACHNSFPVNTSNGLALISGITDSVYTPGETYTVSIVAVDSHQTRWGYEAAAIYMDGGAPRNAGTITTTDILSQTSASGNITYVKQTLAGTAPGVAHAMAWQFNWTAPGASVGAITFYAAANAANNNNSTSGDYIYTAAIELQPIGTGVNRREGSNAPSEYSLAPVYPNPCNNAATVEFTVPLESQVKLALYDISGRQAALPVNQRLGNGSYTCNIDLSGLSSGIYLVSMQSEKFSQIRRLVLIK